MLAIARALVGNPAVILMDEPSEGLAPVVVEEMTRAVRRLAEAEGLTLILVEQNTQTCARYFAAHRGDGSRPHHL